MRLDDERPQVQLRLCALLAEGHDGVHLELRDTLFVLKIGQREREPLGRRHLVEDTFNRNLESVRRLHDDADCTTRSRVQFADGIGEIFGSPPVRHVLWVRPGVEHECSRRVEDAFLQHFLDGGLVVQVTVVVVRHLGCPPVALRRLCVPRA